MADKQPISKPNTSLTQVVHSEAKPKSSGGKPPAKPNPNLGQNIIKGVKPTKSN